MLSWSQLCNSFFYIHDCQLEEASSLCRCVQKSIESVEIDSFWTLLFQGMSLKRNENFQEAYDSFFEVCAQILNAWTQFCCAAASFLLSCFHSAGITNPTRRKKQQGERPSCDMLFKSDVTFTRNEKLWSSCQVWKPSEPALPHQLEEMHCCAADFSHCWLPGSNWKPRQCKSALQTRLSPQRNEELKGFSAIRGKFLWPQCIPSLSILLLVSECSHRPQECSSEEQEWRICSHCSQVQSLHKIQTMNHSAGDSPV